MLQYVTMAHICPEMIRYTQVYPNARVPMQMRVINSIYEPGWFICSGCGALICPVLSQKRALNDIHQALNDIHQAVEERDRIEQRITRGVISARKCGCSWTVIGNVFGVSKQAAWERYRRFIR